MIANSPGLAAAIACPLLRQNAASVATAMENVATLSRPFSVTASGLSFHIRHGFAVVYYTAAA